MSEGLVEVFGIIITFVMLTSISILAYFAAKKILLPIIARRIEGNRLKWDNYLLKRKVFEKSTGLIPLMVFYWGASHLGSLAQGFKLATSILMLMLIAKVVGCLLETIDDIYSTLEVSKEKPIKGFLQVIKITIYILVGISVIASLMGTNPFVLLSGIGAMAAVFSFIFKDTILGLVAGVLLSVNDMLRIGDWIEMPSYGANGDVLEISMNTVKVKNFDLTITTVPAYALISDSFKNWRGIQESGGRRIMRSVHIDVNSVKFCSPSDMKKFQNISLVSSFVQENIERMSQKGADAITNVGIYRAYIGEYLKNHPKIHREIFQIVRQLQPTDKGLPIEIYAFTNDIDWVNYENIQAEIFEHVMVSAKFFDLRLFQDPTGFDLKNINIVDKTDKNTKEN
ncbi:miniconductance mechanosensitive channel [Alkalibacter saccharofermentans DSM 14828]|uniref:Mechanosensing system component YbdG n=2 Tax=Alkalibacter TaxID=274470 RepID=A0A1M4XRJ2_9FIRM|nr:miniconductance mechanosensitive channel [Alkalibacter saccharofermentans DSM 14828]